MALASHPGRGVVAVDAQSDNADPPLPGADLVPAATGATGQSEHRAAVYWPVGCTTGDMDFRRETPDTQAAGRSRLPTPRRLLRCYGCGRIDEVSAADLPGYMATGWPRCCGEVMTYLTGAERVEE